MSSTSKSPEEMKSFFDTRVDGYDQHMAENIIPGFYRMVGESVLPTDAAIQILDLGCGTGLEIEAILRQAPNAHVLGVDLSDRMLSKLLSKYAAYLTQVSVRKDSYLTMDMGQGLYDYVVSAQTMHHLLPEAKVALYNRVRLALKPGGSYIEGDYMVSAEEEAERLKAYRDMVDLLGVVRDGEYHIDIPFTVETQKRLLLNSGFSRVTEVMRRENAGVLIAWQ